MIQDSPKDSILDKWRKSFQSSSYSSLSEIKPTTSAIEKNICYEIDHETEFDEIKLLSDGFFFENENEFNSFDGNKIEIKNNIMNNKDEELIKDTTKSVDDFGFDFEEFSEIDHESFIKSSSNFQSVFLVISHYVYFNL